MVLSDLKNQKRFIIESKCVRGEASDTHYRNVEQRNAEQETGTNYLQKEYHLHNFGTALDESETWEDSSIEVL